MTEDNIIFGKIDDCLELNSTYNDKLYIENGKIVYDVNKVSSEEENILKQMNFNQKTNHYIIVSDDKKADYEGNENVGTISDFSKKVNEGTIENCINGAYIYMAGGNSGGIAGKNDGKIINCMNSGTLENLKKIDAANLGGICGANEGEISKCFNTGEVKATVNDLGGISGINYSKIQNCYNVGNVIGDIYATGGIVGFGVKGQKIIKCYNIGKVTGNVAVGGIIGSCRVGELEDNQWYSEGLEYGIGEAKSNEGAVLNKSLTLNDLKEILK